MRKTFICFIVLTAALLSQAFAFAGEDPSSAAGPADQQRIGPLEEEINEELAKLFHEQAPRLTGPIRENWEAFFRDLAGITIKHTEKYSYDELAGSVFQRYRIRIPDIQNLPDDAVTDFIFRLTARVEEVFRIFKKAYEEDIYFDEHQPIILEKRPIIMPRHIVENPGLLDDSNRWIYYSGLLVF